MKGKISLHWGWGCGSEGISISEVFELNEVDFPSSAEIRR